MDTQKYKTRLEEELNALTASLKGLGVNNPEVKEDWIEKGDDDTASADLNEVADRTEEYDTRRAELANLENRWNDVRAALEKILSGNYGVCEVCGQMIEEDRLEANPSARTCKAHMEEV